MFREYMYNYADMGLIPETHLHNLLPEHITKECLVQLQHCQEFSHAEVGLDYTVTTDAPESSEKLLYFPALCSLEAKSIKWSSDPNLNFSIGWYAKCTKTFDYFPARFLHVVLLRLAFALALPAASCNATEARETAQVYNHRCTMWKNGILWLMEEGVVCTFEIVDNNKGIVAVTKAKESCKAWAAILGKIASIALQAKADFCDTVSLHQFLLKPTDPSSFKDDDKLFDMNDVRRVLREGKDNVLSVGGRELLDSSYLSVLKDDDYWGLRDEDPSILHSKHLGRVALSMYEWEGRVADELGLSRADVARIKTKHPFNLELQTREALEMWKQAHGSEATDINLISAFERAGRRDYAEAVPKLFEADGIASAQCSQ